MLSESSFNQLVEQAREIEYCQEDIAMLAGLLPSDDGDVVALLERCISEKCGQPFSHLWMAAHWADRPVPGRLLEHGVELMPDSTMCFRTARRCTESEPGETARALIAVAEMGHVETFTRLVCLSLVVTDRSAAESTLGPLTEEIPLLARKLARSYRNAHFESALTVKSFLSVLADFLDDAELRKIINERFAGYEEGGGKCFWQEIEGKINRFRDSVPANRPEKILSGYQVRRAVEKVGRNAACPCGSGKKYKRCCMVEDQKKLARSSHVAGKTLEDLDQERELHLSIETLGAMKLHHVMRMDPAKIPKEKAELVIMRLLFFGEYDHGLKLFEASDEKDWEGWKEPMERLFFNAMDADRTELVLKMAEQYRHLEKIGGSDLKYIRSKGDGAKILELIEEDCKEALDFEVDKKSFTNERLEELEYDPEIDGNAPLWSMLLYSLFRTDYPHLAISFTRAVLPILPRDKVDFHLERVEELRDKMGYPPLDVSEEIANLGDALEYKHQLEDVEKRLESQFSDQLENQDAALAHRNRELRELKQSLQESHRRADESEKAAQDKEAALAELKAQSPGAVDRIAANEAEIAELRENMNRLKTEVKRKHHQRNELRRELREVQKAEKEGEHEEVMKQRDHEAAEEALLEPEFEEGEATARGYLAPRIPVFPLNFLDKADSFPNHVIPAALNLVGRLASGDAAAFSGVRMLKATDGLLRVRFSGCFRLIFRVNDHEIEVVDVIDRKDLNRWLLRR